MSLIRRRKSPGWENVATKLVTKLPAKPKTKSKTNLKKNESKMTKLLVSFDTEPVKGLFADGVISEKGRTTVKRLLKKYEMDRNSYVEDLTISGQHAGDISNIRIVEKVEDEYYLLVKNLDAVNQLLIPMFQVFYENEEVSDSDLKDFEKVCE